MLVILDGWGHGKDPKASAITQAATPFVDALYDRYPNSELITFGEDVGLPEGQMGNSEVGHLNIGAGRVVFQELARINNAIKDRSLYQHETLVRALQNAKDEGTAFHLMGLVSDGGVHAHINHLKALIEIAEKNGPEQIFVHVFTDGRDVSPTSGKGFVQDLNQFLEDKRTQIATVIGRYYAMDRDNRWERIKKAYDLLVKGEGEKVTDLVSSIQTQYDQDITDEFMPALVCIDNSENPVGLIKEKDTLLCFNYRTDRPRQISTVLTQKDMPEEGMSKLDLHYLTMTRYDQSFENITVLFQKENIKETLGETIANAGGTQVRIAETEKYPHVTFFFNGGREAVFNGEDRIMIPSPKVATYDLQPDMSAIELTNAIVKRIEAAAPDFICLNYANTDMVGHTGDFAAAVRAAQVVDLCMERLVTKAQAHNYTILVIADHGNSDIMFNADGSPHTAHTTNLVPFIYVNDKGIQKVNDGRLADIAPTILHTMGITVPDAMTGKNLISSND